VLERRSAITEALLPGQYGKVGPIGIFLMERRAITVYQIAAWRDSAEIVLSGICQKIAAPEIPGNGQAVTGRAGVVLSVQPLKWWMFGNSPFGSFDPDQAEIVELSHALTCVHVAGEQAAVLLNRHIPLDLRQSQCPENTVLSTGFHHVGVTLWRRATGFDVFLPQSFAETLVSLLCTSAEQFGYEIQQADEQQQI